MQERERFTRAARVIRELMRHGDLSETELNDALWELIERKTQEKKQPANKSTPEGVTRFEE